MDWLRSFLPSFIHRPSRHPPEDHSEYSSRADSRADFFPSDRFEEDDDRFGGFGFFSPFPRSFEDMRKEMDESFDELFRIFGVDNLPMFDPHIPNSPDSPGFPGGFGRQPRAQLPQPNENVRDRMLKGSDNSHYDDEMMNVRSKMLRRNPNISGTQAGTPEQKDINWDAYLQNGGRVGDILEGKNQPTDGGVRKSSPNFQFRYSSTTTTRRPDGSIETRRVTRDESGNEQETVEVKGSQL